MAENKLHHAPRAPKPYSPPTQDDVEEGLPRIVPETPPQKLETVEQRERKPEENAAGDLAGAKRERIPLQREAIEREHAKATARLTRQGAEADRLERERAEEAARAERQRAEETARHERERAEAAKRQSKKSRNARLGIIGAFAVAIGIALLGVRSGSSRVAFAPVDGSTLLRIIPPLLLVAGFLERALEIVVAGLYGGGRGRTAG